VSNTQMFLAIAGLVSTEIAVVLAFMFHGFSDLKQQINQLIQYMVAHEGRIATVEERTKNMPGAA
jgi:hypothetical protein